MKIKINILTTSQNPKTNSLKMPEFKTKICSFSLCFIAVFMREMGFGKVREYGQKNPPLGWSGGLLEGFLLLRIFKGKNIRIIRIEIV